MFYRILIYIVTLTTLLFSATQLTSPEKTVELLEEIKDDAIIFGSGSKEIHSFIDPKCSMSKRYLQHLFKNSSRLFKRYKIYIYLYELKRKKTGNIIRNVLDSDYPDTLLKAVMVDKTTPMNELDIDDIWDDELEERLERIESTAKMIGVYKRPYIITNGKGK